MEYVEVQRMKRGVVQVDPCRDPNSAGDLGQDDVKEAWLNISLAELSRRRLKSSFSSVLL